MEAHAWNFVEYDESWTHSRKEVRISGEVFSADQLSRGAETVLFASSGGVLSKVIAVEQVGDYTKVIAIYNLFAGRYLELEYHYFLGAQPIIHQAEPEHPLLLGRVTYRPPGVDLFQYDSRTLLLPGIIDVDDFRDRFKQPGDGGSIFSMQ